MAKSTEKTLARNLRRSWESIKVIAGKLGISRSTASAWCIDIQLSPEQINTLNARRVAGGFKGRLIGARKQHEKKIQNIEFWEMQGRSKMSNLIPSELFMVGLGLYMGEGSKDVNKFQFTNSNPDIIRLVILWLQQFLGVDKNNLYCHILINEIHAYRTNEVELAWCEALGFKEEQFRKTILIHSQSKKTYENQDTHIGTLALRAKKGAELQRRILGLMHGLLYNIADKKPA